MLLPLVQSFTDVVKVSLYHSPSLRGLLKLLLPERFNETVALTHLKVYLTDNTVIMSGCVISPGTTEFSHMVNLRVQGTPLISVVDPDLELRVGGGSLDFLVLLAFFPSVISSFFTQNKGGRGARAPPLDLPLNMVIIGHLKFGHLNKVAI